MKSLLRHFLINLVALYATSKLLPGLTIEGGVKTLILAAVGLMVVNFLVVPLLKIMFLPLNLLTLGIFAWVVNVVALYLLTAFLPGIKIVPYNFAGTNFGTLIIPAQELNVLMVAILASFLIGLTSHFLQWLCGR
jgi:putative membrane protein